MSEVRLVVREAGHDWSGVIHGSSADRAIAALSADPVTLAELEAACARFAKPTTDPRFLASLLPGLLDEPYDAGIVLIDLVARLVVVDSTYSSAGPTGEVSYHDGQTNTDTWLRYHLAEDWLFTSDHCQWQGLSDKRQRERTTRPLLHTREVFYGRPFLEFIARETFAAFARRMTIGPSQPENPSSDPQRTVEEFSYDALREIHAAWLLTPREDLGGVCPRDVALERRAHLEWDLQDQCERWSLLGQCPPGLDKSSLAFRYGGFGTHELVEYYSLVRALLWSCWRRLVESRETQAAATRPEALTVGDFLTSEIPRLESVRDQWLDTPDPECHGRTPRSIIDRERARLPEAMSGHDAVIDPDCPCCQMVADMPGPMFWHLDASGFDDDFAFDIYRRTREEWEEERRRWEEHSKRFNAEWSERERLGVTGSGSSGAGQDSVWSSSFSVGDAADAPLGIRLFGIGTHLAELIVDIRGYANGPSAAPQAQQFIDQLNRDFGNLRELLQTSEPSVAEALINPVIDRFSESLAAVALARPDLSAKCESLTSSLTRFLDPAPSEPTWESGDSENPF
jgi:hypothetical protein